MSSIPHILSRLRHYNDIFLRSTPFWLNIACLAHAFTTHIGLPHGCYGPSMLPTLSISNDVVWCSRSYRRGRGIQVGDVVEVRHPMMPEVGAIKRVIGLPGDFVVRDPTAVVEDGMLQVPEGHCWIMGDNLSASRDSRFYGPIPLALVQGKITHRIWPWGERKRIENNLRHVGE